MLERLHIYDTEALTAPISFFCLKDAIEGFFDKVANSTKNNRMDFLMKSGTGLPHVTLQGRQASLFSSLTDA